MGDAMESFDVLIVGAGLSGIGAAWHLQERCPGKSYAIVEARDAIGGTWDLFRYPGIRSDSDMHTLGYRFKPWTKAKAIADGPAILDYVRETAREAGIDRHIRFNQRVVAAEWDGDEARWTVTTRDHDGAERQVAAGFVMMCSGYYSYDEAYQPDWGGEDEFRGRIVHPQFWPEDLDYAGKRVVVIGSGATAVTLVPELAKQAAHVTMLQRSPTYFFDRPAEDAFANKLRETFSPLAAYRLTRLRNVGMQQFFYRMARKHPEKAKERMIGMVRDALGPGHDVETHFTPKYNVWDQRVCLVPDSDLFTAIREKKAEVVTDTIERFTPDGLKLTSGKTIAADIVVTATGLKLNVLGDVAFSVDGVATDLSKSLIYKGMMLGDVPNMAFVFGYTNASWTLKADLTSEFVCRLLNTMAKRGAAVATPVPTPELESEPFLDFSSGYVQRAVAKLPKQGTKKPWKLYQNYALDYVTLRFGKVEDGTMRFSGKRTRAAA
jgi:monooxygenase